MADIIHLLEDHIANQIAAGEVVQRPASVVKELLENSIDSGASQIQLIIKESGRNLIQVIDNGKGMSMTDARMSFERHATSKIKTSEDIFNIHTKGFRGEALASIAAVSQIEMKTSETDGIGSQILIEGNSLISQEQVNMSKGTFISVKNLFYNVPARRKFLKSNAVEFRHILDEFHRIALAHENVSFQLFNNNTEIFRLRPGSQLQRITEIFGKKIQSSLVPISEEFDWIRVSGFVGKPENAKKNRGEQFFFANQRFFRSNYLNKAVISAFDQLISNQTYPSYFLYIDIDPQKIDVNIHPTKTEIKFEDESSIFALLLSSIKKSLGVYHIIPSLDFEQDPEWSFIPINKNKLVSEPQIVKNPNFNPFNISSGTSNPNNLISKNSNNLQKEKKELSSLYSSLLNNHVNNQENIQAEIFDIPASSEKSFLRINNGNWIYEKNKELLQINPYRIHQTIIYNTLMKNSQKNILSQQLLFPIEKSISVSEKSILDTIKIQLFSKGFDIELQEDLLTISAIPSDIPQEKVLSILEELLGQIEEHPENEFDLILTQSICKIAAKTKNEFIQESQLIPIIIEFEKIGMPLYNPFNKLNYCKFSIKDF